MNSNGEYTICNLDNNTYSTSYPDPISTSNYSYSNVNNGLVDTGQQYGYGGPGPGSGHHHGNPGLQDLTGGQQQGHGMGPAYDGTASGVLNHGSGPGQQPSVAYGLHPGACGGGPGPNVAQNHGQTPYPPYYGPPGNLGMNGSIPDMSPHHGMPNPGYPGSCYPDHADCNPIMCNSPGTTMGYGVMCNTQGLSSSPNHDQGTPTTTYKWMTVKRSTPKTGEKGDDRSFLRSYTSSLSFKAPPLSSPYLSLTIAKHTLNHLLPNLAISTGQDFNVACHCDTSRAPCFWGISVGVIGCRQLTRGRKLRGHKSMAVDKHCGGEMYGSGHKDLHWGVYNRQ